ncbi:hypothetical protein ACK2WC_17325, partial [Mycobacterium tuberculosis]
MTTAAGLSGIDLTDLDNFADGFPHHLFAIHRREAPVYWHRPTEHTPDGEGFWSVATYAETLEVLRDPVTYSSVTGGQRRFGGTVLQDLPVAGQVLNMMDDPRHTQQNADHLHGQFGSDLDHEVERRSGFYAIEQSTRPAAQIVFDPPDHPWCQARADQPPDTGVPGIIHHVEHLAGDRQILQHRAPK